MAFINRATTPRLLVCSGLLLFATSGLLLAQSAVPPASAPPTATSPSASPPPSATGGKIARNKSKKVKQNDTSAAPAAPSSAAPAGSGGPAVFPGKVDAKYASQKAGDARMHTCLDQYHANKAANGNGGMKWIQKGGGYYSMCSKKLKG